MVNSANAQVLVDYFEKFPDKHSQTTWVGINGKHVDDIEEVKENFCKTTMCMAGAATYLMTNRDTFIDCIDGNAQWTQVGGKVLGLTTDQADCLFYTMNERAALDMLKAAAANDMDAFERIWREYDEDELQAA